MRLLSVNIKGGGDPEKVKEVLSFLASNKIDFAFLCESHMTEERVAKYLDRWRNYGWFSNCSSSNSCGATFIILRPDKIPLDDCKVIRKDDEGRQLGLELTTDGGKIVRILGIYAPNEETNSVNFFNGLHAGEDLSFHIMLGDFNRCQEPYDRTLSRSEDNRVLNALTEGTQNGRLIDGWRETNPDKRQYTYWSNNVLLSASRLDRIYVTQRVFQKCLKWEIISTPGWTDHQAVSVEYCPRDQIKIGTGQWYMNVHLLKHQVMKESLSGVLQTELSKLAKLLGTPDEGGYRSPLPESARQVIEQFDYLLEQIRTKAKQIQEDLSKKRNKIQKNFERRINHLDNLDRTPGRARKLKGLKIRLEALQEVTARRKTLLAKAKWIEMGAHRHADFWNLGKTPVEDRKIQGLQNAEGKVRSD